jgi:hypothetical protein
MKDDVKSDWDVPKETQDALLTFITDELTVAIRNNKRLEDEFKEYYNMIHGIREKRQNDWESDIYLPEFLSRLLTQIGNFCAQYFSSTDYVDTSLESDDPKDVAEARASKRLLNTILNDKYTYYYHKIVRTIMYVFTCGHGIIKGGYDQQIDQVISHHEQKSEFMSDDLGGFLAEDGTPYLDPTIQKPAIMAIQTPVYKDDVKRDFPTFDVYPVQNVYMSPEYSYSLNDKKYVIFETEQSLEELKDDADRLGYFNLDLLEDKDPEGKLGEKTYNQDGKLDEPDKQVEKMFVLEERWGKFWVVDKEGEAKPGMDKNGEFKENAELEECIITVVKDRSKDEPHTIIRFQKSPHTRRPMARFLCYVDMVNDNGFGDGEINRELQKAINDNYNLMNYRSKLAITPAFKGKRFSGIAEHIRITPEKTIMLENIDDLQEFKIEDNIQGGVIHQNLLSSRMDYIMATSPQTMGQAGERAETATVGSIVNQRANVRIGMKSMNLEFIGFTEFYDMLLTLCNDFMLPKTLEDLIGDDAKSYNPKRKDKFRPVSQALETDESKQFKIKAWQGIMQMAGSVPNPKTPQVLNYALGQILELMGGSFSHFKKFMFEEDEHTLLLYQLATGAKGLPTPPQPQNPMAPPSNQMGMPQGQGEQMARQNAPQQVQ